MAVLEALLWYHSLIDLFKATSELSGDYATTTIISFFPATIQLQDLLLFRSLDKWWYRAVEVAIA